MNAEKPFGNAVFGLIAMLLLAGAGPVWAEPERSDALRGEAELSDTGLFYINKAFNNAIFGYPNLPDVGIRVRNPQIVYVDRAYGPAIYSYPRVGQDIVTPFNVRYVNTAFGPAIYSYPGVYNEPGRAESWPMTAD